MRFFFFLVLISFFFFSCSDLEKNMDHNQTQNMERYDLLLEKYGLEEVLKVNWENLSEEELKEVPGMDFKEIELSLSNKRKKMDEAHEREVQVYSLFVEASSDIERKEVVKKYCSYFLHGLCHDIEKAFQLLPSLYSAEKADYYKKILKDTEGMTSIEYGKYLRRMNN